MKRIIITLLFCILVFSLLYSPVFAVITPTPGCSLLNTGIYGIDQGGLFERTLASIVNAVRLAIQTLPQLVPGGGYRTLGELVFTTHDLSDFMNPAPLQDWWPKLNFWYVQMTLIASALCLLAIFFTAFRFMKAGVMAQPDVRAEA